jgi:hypothetical protein
MHFVETTKVGVNEYRKHNFHRIYRIWNDVPTHWNNSPCVVDMLLHYSDDIIVIPRKLSFDLSP